jgi:hypothetical protein
MAEKKRRAPGQRKIFGVQETTPTGGVIRNGVRGEGADQRNVEKRLEFTPGQAHWAEYETCDQKKCSSSKRCKQCAKFTKQNIKNARTAKSLPGQSKNDREAKRLFLSEDLAARNTDQAEDLLVLSGDPETRSLEIKKRQKKIARERMSETELQENNQKRREKYNMSEEGLQEKNQKRRENYNMSEEGLQEKNQERR